MYKILFLLLFVTLHANAWDHHQGMMSQLMDTQAASSREFLKTIITIPSEEEQKKTIQSIAKELEINFEKIPFQKPGKISVSDFLEGESIDEPDQGMDQDLPESADPKNDRAWMGGKTGPTSQGFRHMFFKGIEWGSPLRTLQIPFHSIGQSPERTHKLHELSQKYFQAKDLFWGLRILLWELHFIQDLHQPFHVMQVPYFKMLPWKELMRKFVPRSTQVIANYHYAYEGLINESIQEGKLSVLAPCMEPGAGSMNDTVEFSRSKAQEIGIPLYSLWDSVLKDPIMDLPEGMGALDYYSYLHANPEEENQQSKVDSVQAILKTTCEIMKHLSQETFSKIDQAFKLHSINSGK